MRELKTEQMRLTKSERELLEYLRGMSILTLASIYTSCHSCIKLERENVIRFADLLKKACIPSLK